MISSIGELAQLKGQKIWLVTCFKANKDRISVMIGNTHIADWTVGSVINPKGEEYAEHLEGPWFCFEQNRTRVKGRKICNFVFNPNDYIGFSNNRLFTTQTQADNYRMLLKIKLSSTKIDFTDLSQYFVFEGASIGIEDFLAGQIPTFGKDAWVKES